MSVKLPAIAKKNKVTMQSRMPSLQLPTVDQGSTIRTGQEISPSKMSSRTENLHGIGGLVKDIGGTESNPQYSVYNIQPYFRPPTSKFGYSKRD